MKKRISLRTRTDDEFEKYVILIAEGLCTRPFVVSDQEFCDRARRLLYFIARIGELRSIAQTDGRREHDAAKKNLYSRQGRTGLALIYGLSVKDLRTKSLTELVQTCPTTRDLLDQLKQAVKTRMN